MITLYLFENIIQYKEKEEIKEFVFPKKAMKYGKIRNIPLFEKKLEELVKKEKWVSFFQTKQITIILPLHYEEIDKEILLMLLNELGFKKTKTKKEINLYKRKNNQVILNIHNSYATLFVQKKGKTIKKFYPTNIFFNVEKMLNFILQNYENESLFHIMGSYPNMKTLVKNLANTKCLYFKNSRTYLLEKYIP